MAKPTKRILDWASGGTATDPGAGKEAAGWALSEKPPAYWWNWILQSFGDWLSYFDSGEVDDDGDDLTLIRTATRDTNGHIFNTYFSDDSYYIARNSEWQQGTGWGSVGAGAPSVIQLNPDAVDPEIIMHHGSISGGSFTKTFSAAPIKAWGVVRSGASPSIIYNGANLSSVGPAGTNTLDLELDVDFSSEPDMAVIVTGEDNGYHFACSPQDVNTLRISAHNIVGGTTLDLNTSITKFHIAVMGELA